MGTSVDSAQWVAQLTDEDLVAVTDWGTVARGTMYAEDNRVRSVVAGDGGRVLLAEVVGSNAVSYTTIVTRSSPAAVVPPTWYGRCSCPMRTDCKHVVAVLITARTALVGAQPLEQDWRQALGPLLAAAARPRTDAAPLGLFVTLIDGVVSRWGERQRRRVILHPTRLGKTGRWVKNLTWTEVEATYRPIDADPRHVEALVAILQAHRAAARPRYGYGNPEVVLDDLGPHAWPLLRGARAVGVSILRHPDQAGSVVLETAPASVRLDVRADGDDLLVVPIVHEDGPGDGGREVDAKAMDAPATHGQLPALRPPAVTAPPHSMGATAWLVGDPAHGLVRVEGDDVHLVELTATVPAPVRDLVADGRLIRVPGEDVGAFLAMYLPHLGHLAPLTSSDGSVDFSEPSGPRVVVRVHSPAPLTIRVETGFAYGEGPRRVVVPPWSGPAPTARTTLRQDPSAQDLLDATRDLDGESGLIGRLPVLDEVDLRVAPDRLSPHGRWRIAALRDLHGMAAVVFTQRVLPQLRVEPDVEVEVDGPLPTFERVVEAPLVRVGTSEATGAGGSATQDWFDLHITVEVAGEEVPFEPLFQALVRGDDMMVLPSGFYFGLDSPELATLRGLIEEAREMADPRRKGLRLSRFDVSLWEELVALGVVDRQAAKWASGAAALQGLANRPAPTVPEHVQASLRPYQVEGYGWLAALWDARLGGILADDMGLGKTLQVLAMLQRAADRGELGGAAGPVLVVAPTSVVGTWVGEAQRFVPHLPIVALTETGRRRGTDLADAVAGAALIVTSYAILRIDGEEFAALPWAGLVLDEAQFVKNHQSKTYQAARRIGAPFTLAVTGTPLENSLMDLWSMLSLAAPGLYPSPERFTRTYRKPIESGERPELLQRLRRRIRPLMLRRTKDQVAADLPPKTDQVLLVPLSAQHARIYARQLQRERAKVLGLLADPDGNRVAILRSLTLLRQLALHPGLVDDAHAGLPSAKVETLVELLSELAAEGHRALVFSQFTTFLRLVRDRLEAEGLGTAYLDGRTRDRQQRIEAFRTGSAAAFLISLKAGGFGLTLTEADYVFVLDPWWNPAAEAQAIDRAHRIGQDKPVVVYRLVSAGTIEEKVVALQERKRDLFARVVDDGALGSGVLSAEDIAGLLEVDAPQVPARRITGR
jgi:hypothetical protein